MAKRHHDERSFGCECVASPVRGKSCSRESTKDNPVSSLLGWGKKLGAAKTNKITYGVSLLLLVEHDLRSLQLFFVSRKRKITWDHLQGWWDPKKWRLVFLTQVNKKTHHAKSAKYWYLRPWKNHKNIRLFLPKSSKIHQSSNLSFWLKVNCEARRVPCAACKLSLAASPTWGVQFTRLDLHRPSASSFILEAYFVMKNYRLFVENLLVFLTLIKTFTQNVSNPPPKPFRKPHPP